MSILHSTMSTSTITPRDSKYCQAIAVYMAATGHATNAMILDALRTDFPNLSATTVHRATARLASRGELGLAPSDSHGAIRYDYNTAPHDHFMCSNCGVLRDTDIASEVLPIIETSLEDCHISGRLTISGTCKLCHQKEDI